LKSILGLEEPYSKDELEELLCEVEMSFSRTTQIGNQRCRYWILKLFEKKLGQSLNAIVLDRFPYRYQIWLSDYYLDADLPIPYGKNLKSEEPVSVIIEKVNPRENILKLRLEE